MMPRTGGRPSRPAESRFSTLARSATSQRRIKIFAPASLSMSICCFALPFNIPLRDSSTIVTAPLLIIHVAMLRPRPPVPPTRTYVASCRKMSARFSIRGALQSISHFLKHSGFRAHRDKFIISRNNYSSSIHTPCLGAL